MDFLFPEHGYDDSSRLIDEDKIPEEELALIDAVAEDEKNADILINDYSGIGRMQEYLRVARIGFGYRPPWIVTDDRVMELAPDGQVIDQRGLEYGDFDSELVFILNGFLRENNAIGRHTISFDLFYEEI